jgi:hypothetical protein
MRDAACRHGKTFIAQRADANGHSRRYRSSHRVLAEIASRARAEMPGIESHRGGDLQRALKCLVAISCCATGIVELGQNPLPLAPLVMALSCIRAAQMTHAALKRRALSCAASDRSYRPAMAEDSSS